MLLVLFLGIADFGRVFSAGIALEATARNGAEAAAQEYVQLLRNRSSAPTTSDYQRLHWVAIEEVCAEAKLLPSHVITGTGDCEDLSDGTATLTSPAVAVCVHDGSDPICGTESGAAPADGRVMHLTTWAPTVEGYDPPGTQGPLPHVEVQVCYRFTTLMNAELSLPLGWGISLGQIWMERGREFAVACYEQTTGPCN